MIFENDNSLDFINYNRLLFSETFMVTFICFYCIYSYIFELLRHLFTN